MSEQLIKFIALGSDPEFFLVDELNNPVSSEGLIGGSKDEPRLLSEEGHMVQEDNVMVEMNIPPVRDKKRFVTEINKVIELTYGILPKGLQIVAEPSMNFPVEVLSTEHACKVGCEPDYNAYDKVENPIPELPNNKRFAGGHIHVSFENPCIEYAEFIVYAMDMYLGVPAVLLDTDEERKKVYGIAGRFRPKPYGVEYRTLSNFWLKSTEMIEWAFDQTITAINNAHMYDSKIASEVESIINSNDKVKAEEFCKKYNIALPILYKEKSKV